MVAATSLKGQYYQTGIGLRVGAATGVTVKHFISSRHALEGILSTRWRGVTVTGLYEIHDDAFDAPGLTWHYGFGAHIGFWNGRYVKWAEDDINHGVIGIDGVIGLEYNFPQAPINVSLDWKPAFNLIGHSGFWGDSGGVSIRYIF